MMRDLQRWAWCVVAAGGLASAAHTQTIDDFVAWVDETAVRFETFERPMPAALASTWSALRADRRLVLLGEPDHFIAERYELRLWLMDALYAEGFRDIIAETGVEDARQLDEVLAGGERRTSHACMLSLLGESGVDRWDIASVGPGIEETSAAFHDELRLASAGDRWRIHGMDVEVPPPCAYVRMLTLLDVHAHSAADLARIRDELRPIADESMGAEQARIALARLFFSSSARRLERSLGADVMAELSHALDQLEASVVLWHMIDGDAGPMAQRRIFSHREEQMMRNTERLLEQGGDDWQAVFLGHNAHFAYDHNALANGELDGFAVPLWKTLGASLAETRREDLFSVWLMTARGTRVEPDGVGGVTSFEFPPDSIEAAFARVGGAFVLSLQSDDPRAAWLDEARHFGVNGELAHGRLRELTDVVVFVPECRAIDAQTPAAITSR